MAGLWLLPLADLSSETYERLAALLDSEELARRDRFVPPERRLQHVAAHGLKRRVLANLTGGAPESLGFGVGENGKPFLTGASNLDFSLSHCDGLVGIAVARGACVGLDLEPCDREIDPVIAERFFSSAENRTLQASGNRSHDLLRIWTLKEAYLKATGRGMTQELDSFSMALDPLGVCEAARDVGAFGQWTLWQEVLRGSHFGAVAFVGPAGTFVDAVGATASVDLPTEFRDIPG